MGSSIPKHIYTNLIELYLRAVIRNWHRNQIPDEWHKFTLAWLYRQTETDRDFLYFVFSEDYFHSVDGVACYPSESESYFDKCERLHRLEKQYAIDSGLILDKDNKDNECIGTEPIE